MRCYLLLCCLFFQGLIGQENVSSTRQLWVDYNQKWLLSERVSMNLPVGMKTITSGVWNRFYVSPEVRYKMPKVIFKSLKYKEDFRGGVEFYYNQNTSGTDVVEITPFQGYSLTWPNRERIDLRHYVKLRERFQFNTTDWTSVFGLKLSYELSLTYKFQGDLWKYGKGFYLPISLKFYWNLIDVAVFNNVFRITPGLGYQFDDSWKCAFLVGYNRTRNDIAESFKTNDIIFRLRLYYTLDKKKNKTISPDPTPRS